MPLFRKVRCVLLYNFIARHFTINKIYALFLLLPQLLVVLAVMRPLLGRLLQQFCK